MILNFRFLGYLFLSGFLFLSSSNAVFGVGLTYESFISTEASKIELKGEYPGGQFGAVLNSGDLNGDGIDDLVVGIPFASTDEKQWNGAVKIIFGGFEEKIESIFFGENSGDQLGTSIAVGDFNGDFIDDLAMAARNSDTESEKTGKIHILYGNTEIENKILGSEYLYFNIEVGLTEGKFDFSLQAYDINRDNITDLIVGAPYDNSLKISQSGAVYIYPGSFSGLESEPKITIFGNSKGSRFGGAVLSDDFDSDGDSEIFISAYLARKNDLIKIGKVFYYDVLQTASSSLVLARMITFPNKAISGNSSKEFFGFALDSGDLNGDYIADLAATSFPYAGEKTDAKVSIYYGGGDMTTPDIVIKNPRDDALIGASVLLTDLNADGLDDIVIGAPGISYSKSEEPGEVYIIFSSEDGYKSKYSVADLEVDNIIHGENGDDWFGYSLAALDFNNDGLEDLAIGSRYSDIEDGVNNGKVFILPGKNGPYGEPRSIAVETDGPNQELSRGELITMAIKSFNLKEKKAAYIQNCYSYIDFCLFNFMAMSSFNGIDLGDQMLLYPDVNPGDEYYEDINLATILGLINGYLNEPESPFKPYEPVTRIQALKIVLGAADLVPSKYKFELVAMLGSYLNLISQSSVFGDIDSKISHMWWYPRYVNFAVEHGIVDEGDYFRPDDKITPEELSDMINRTLDYINSKDAQA